MVIDLVIIKTPARHKMLINLLPDSVLQCFCHTCRAPLPAGIVLCGGGNREQTDQSTWKGDYGQQQKKQPEEEEEEEDVNDNCTDGR